MKNEANEVIKEVDSTVKEISNVDLREIERAAEKKSRLFGLDFFPVKVGDTIALKKVRDLYRVH